MEQRKDALPRKFAEDVLAHESNCLLGALINEHNPDVVAVLAHVVRKKGWNHNGVDQLAVHDKHTDVTPNSLLRVEDRNLQNEGNHKDVVRDDQHHDGLEVFPQQGRRGPFERDGILQNNEPALLNGHQQRRNLPKQVGNVVQDEGIVSLRCVQVPVGRVHKDHVKVEIKDELEGR